MARPGAVLGRAHQPGPHGVQVAAAHHREDMAASVNRRWRRSG
jgi:hypothetical protein